MNKKILLILFFGIGSVCAEILEHKVEGAIKKIKISTQSCSIKIVKADKWSIKQNDVTCSLKMSENNELLELNIKKVSDEKTDYDILIEVPSGRINEIDIDDHDGSIELQEIQSNFKIHQNTGAIIGAKINSNFNIEQETGSVNLDFVPSKESMKTIKVNQKIGSLNLSFDKNEQLDWTIKSSGSVSIKNNFVKSKNPKYKLLLAVETCSVLIQKQ